VPLYKDTSILSGLKNDGSLPPLQGNYANFDWQVHLNVPPPFGIFVNLEEALNAPPACHIDERAHVSVAKALGNKYSGC
jgi:hypothetical protein